MSSDYTSVCGLFFWIKVVLSMMIALGIIGFQGYLVYRSHLKGSAISSFINSPDEIQILGNDNCNAMSTLARLEPKSGQFLWGMSVQWDVDTAIQLTNRLKKTVAIFNTFLNINNTHQEIDILNWQAQEVQRLGGMLEVSVFPTIDLKDLTDMALYKLAVQMRKINLYYGVPVYLRFAPEMNGEWMVNHGLRPVAFKEKFKILARYIHTLTNLTAMVWAPNIGRGVVRGSNAPGQFSTNYPKTGEAEFTELDTNNDGLINGRDDPYTPYYPGDEYVDWVAMSLYNYERSTTTNNQQSSPPNKAIEEINLLGFYDTFVKGKKPLMIPETGGSSDTQLAVPKHDITPHTPQYELENKKAWITAINNAQRQFPELKAAVWFEEIKPENVPGSRRYMRDFRITKNSALSQMFLETVEESDRKIVFVDGTVKNEVYKCSGALNF